MNGSQSIGLIAMITAAAVGGALLGRSQIVQADATVAASTEMKFATVDVLGIVARMLESDMYKPANLANAEKYDAELRTMLQELEGIRNRALAEPETSPTRKSLEAEFIDKNGKFEQSRASAQQAIEQFNTEQVSEAYRLVCESANSLAQSLGYSHVIVSRGIGERINSNTVAGAVQEILARPVIRSVPADDLTERLIRNFKLESIAVPGQAAPTDETPK